MTLGVLASGEVVKETFRSQIQLDREILENALQHVDAHGQLRVVAEVFLGDDYGLVSRCVETSSTDDIYWGRRLGQNHELRFVRGRQPEPTPFVTVVLRYGFTRGEMLLVTAHAGPRTPPMPSDARATTESDAFWAKHALIPEDTD